MNPSSKILFICAFCCIFFLLFPQSALSQDLSSNDSYLQQLESFIGILEEQEKLLDYLIENLTTGKDSIRELKNLNSLAKEKTTELIALTKKISETSRRQSSLSIKYEKNLERRNIFRDIARIAILG